MTKTEDEVRPVKNTSKVDPSLMLLNAMTTGTTASVKEQEKEGQHSLLQSTLLPVSIRPSSEEALFLQLGFEFGKVYEAEPLFREAKLPPGWSKEGTSHSMHTDLVDEKGFIRGDIFYKAAFYDRKANMGLFRRISVQEDYDALDKDGTLSFHVSVVMPGRPDDEGCLLRKTIHTLTHEKKWEANKSYKARHEVRGEAEIWLKNNYPDHDSVLAYWDIESFPTPETTFVRSKEET